MTVDWIILRTVQKLKVLFKLCESGSKSEKDQRTSQKNQRINGKRQKKFALTFAFAKYDYSLKVHSHRDLVNQCMGDWRFLFLLLSETKIPNVHKKMRTEPTVELFLTSSDRIQKFAKGGANTKGGGGANVLLAQNFLKNVRKWRCRWQSSQPHDHVSLNKTPIWALNALP